MLALAFMLQHGRQKFSNSVQFGIRLKKASRVPLVFAPSVFITGLRVFSLEIVINLLFADKSDRAGNIITCREKSPWIMWNPVWMFHNIAAERLSHAYFCFSAYVSLLLFWCFHSWYPLSFSFSDFLFFLFACLSLSFSLSCFSSFWCQLGDWEGSSKLAQMNNASKAKAKS